MIIYLNGTSSSGKTTLATWIQANSSHIFFYYSIDTLLECMPARELEPIRKSAKNPRIDWDNLWNSDFRSARSMVDSGLDLILDCPLYDIRADLYKKHIEGNSTISVFLDCPLEELKRRESERGDRWVGLAEYQVSRVRSAIHHDLTFDSSVESVEAMGTKILEAKRPPPKERP